MGNHLFGQHPIPFGNQHAKLGHWVDAQRSFYKSSILAPDRIGRLEDIGFIWDTLSAAWEEMYVALLAYRAEHGDCNVPQRYAENPKLAKWVVKQRARYNSNKLSPSRIKRLEDIDFFWDPFSVVWEEMYAALVAYRAEHGDCNVPQMYTESSKLGKWVHQQRVLHKSSRLIPDRIKRLKDIGFVWAPSSAAWEEMYAALLAYRAEHGDCNVPSSYTENPKLGKWVTHQRSFYNTNKLNSDRFKRLENIGFVWDVSSAFWEEMYAALLVYRAEHGDCNVPAHSYAENPKLGAWVNRQRRAYKSGNLDTALIRRLEEIDFVWDQLSTVWEEMYAALVEYTAKHGDCNVPFSYADNPKLGKWVSTQRARYKSNKLSPDRIKRLEDIGFEWSRGGSGKGEE